MEKNAILAEHKWKFLKSEKIDKYLDLARELKTTIEYEGDGDINCTWCALKVPKGLVKRVVELDIRGRIETIQTTALLRSIVKYFVESWRPEETWCH